MVLLLAALPRLLNLDATLSPDEPQWERNTQGFVEGLRTGRLNLLYQQPHPGLTTMWLAAPTIASSSWGVKRLPVALTLVVLILAVASISNRLFGEPYGFGIGVLLALDPLFVAHSRILAMDALLAVFLLLAVLLLLVWQHERQVVWLVLSGAAAALAVLSKLPGAVVIPFTAGTFAWMYIRRDLTAKAFVRGTSLWLLALVVTAVVVLPTLVTDFGVVWQGTRQFFTTEHYRQSVHALGPWWYPQALLLWSMPLAVLALLGLPALLNQERRLRGPLLVLAVFATIFFLAMQYSIKKGDRYLLPSFLYGDVVAATVMVWVALRARRGLSQWWYRLFAITLLSAALWQGIELGRLHPYALAYRNPWFKSVARGRTMGWGEGLELAAKYLNQKPHVDDLLVVAHYEGPFSYRFKGKVTSAERLPKESAESIGADYVVLYRAMQGRAPDRWETKVLSDYANKRPEHIVTLNGEEYVWIYAVK